MTTEKHIETLKLLRNRSNFAFSLPNLLRQQSRINIGQNTAISNGYSSQKLAQFFIIPNSKLNVPRDNTVLLVIPSSIPSQFQNLNHTIEKLRLEFSNNYTKLKILKFRFNSKQTSAARYSRTAERQTGAPAPTRSAYFPAFKNLAILPTGNWRPALEDLETDLVAFGLPLPPLVVELIFLVDGKSETLKL